MLDELIVRNLGILEDVRLEPGGGFTVITGETGAGKTLLLGALRLLLGESASSDMVGPFGAETVVEGRFVDASGSELAASRRLTEGGRSRAYLDGSIASASALDQATRGLVDLIGQHDQLSLTRPTEVRGLIDRLLDSDGRRALDDYREAWRRHRDLLVDREQLGGDRPALERERELVEFQAKEIDRAGFEPGEDITLESVLARVRNAEALRAHLGDSGERLDQSRDQLGAAVTELRKAAAIDPVLAEPLSELEALEAQLGEAAYTLSSNLADLESQPDVLEEAEQRWQLLADLKRRYGPSLQDVIDFGSASHRRAEELSSLLGRANRLDADLDAARQDLLEAGTRLREARTEAGRRLATEALGHLVELGFRSPTLLAQVADSEPTAAGADTATLMFASDTRLNPGEIRRVASGGELSRLVLALRLAGGAGEARTVIFDEIDAGVGGSTALAIGQKLAALSADRQVLCVTHLPQVAAYAGVHYVITRDDTAARLARVEGDDRVDEITRMLAGLPDSERGREAAIELLEAAGG